METQIDNLEVISCENGWLVIEVASASTQHFIRKKWVAATREDLGKLIMQLAPEPTETRKKEVRNEKTS